MLGELFRKILDMSLVGCYSILIVMVFRFLLSKCERKYAYYLWFVVFLNLCIPFSIQGVFSLIPDSVAEFSIVDAVEGALGAEGRGDVRGGGEVATFGGVQAIMGGNFTMADGNLGDDSYLSQTPIQEEEPLPMKLAAGIWVAGIAFMLVWNLAGTVQLKKQVSRENWVRFSGKKGIAEVAGLDAPFLWGIWKPMIYLPTDLEEEERRYVVAHERYHRKRKDYLVKIAVFLIVMIHWFNPLVWIAYALFCKDMEISCDEAVILQFKGNIRKQYAGSLLKYAARQNGYSLTPITFGEPAVKTRIKNVLRFKKRGILISALAAICVVGVAAGLMLRPSAQERMEDNPSQMADNPDVLGGHTPETDTSQSSEEVEESGWYGSYMVTDYTMAGITAMGPDEASDWVNNFLLVYDQDQFIINDNLVGTPMYRESFINREVFGAEFRGYTFEALGIEGDSVLCVNIDNYLGIGCSFYVCDENKILIPWDGVFFTAERVEQSGNDLSKAQKDFLQAMCDYIPIFEGRSEMDEAFWKSFIFRSFTGVHVPINNIGEIKPIYGEGELVWVNREDLGFEENEFKISEEYVREYAWQVFGVEMPEIKPAFEDMSEGQTALYYQDGYYYIGQSDFGETEYRFRDLEAAPGGQETSVYANYDILLHNFYNGEQVSVGTVRFGLSAADNANGFVVTSKDEDFSNYDLLYDGE